MKSDRFFLRFNGLGGPSRFLGPTAPSKQQFVDLKWPIVDIESHVADALPGFYTGESFAREIESALRCFANASVVFKDGTLEVDSGDDNSCSSSRAHRLWISCRSAPC